MYILQEAARNTMYKLQEILETNVQVWKQHLQV